MPRQEGPKVNPQITSSLVSSPVPGLDSCSYGVSLEEDHPVGFASSAATKRPKRKDFMSWQSGSWGPQKKIHTKSARNLILSESEAHTKMMGNRRLFQYQPVQAMFAPLPRLEQNKIKQKRNTSLTLLHTVLDLVLSHNPSSPQFLTTK